MSSRSIRAWCHIPCKHHPDRQKTQMVGNYNDCPVQPTGGSHTGEKINKFIGKRKPLGPTDGFSNYIAGWMLTIEPDGNVLNHSHQSGPGENINRATTICSTMYCYLLASFTMVHALNLQSNTIMCPVN